MKVNKAFKLFFFDTRKQQQKKTNKLCLNFFSNPNTSVQRCQFPISNSIPSFPVVPPLPRRIFNLKATINKMADEHRVNYLSCPSRLNSRLNVFVFVQTP